MQDYYTTLAAIDANSLIVNDLQAQINSLQQNINWLNDYYFVLYHSCGVTGSGQPPTPAARQECMDSVWSEWWLTVSPMEYELGGLQMSVAGTLAQLNADLQLLAVIKTELGIP